MSSIAENRRKDSNIQKQRLDESGNCSSQQEHSHQKQRPKSSVPQRNMQQKEQHLTHQQYLQTQSGKMQNNQNRYQQPPSTAVISEQRKKKQLLNDKERRNTFIIAKQIPLQKLTNNNVPAK